MRSIVLLSICLISLRSYAEFDRTILEEFSTSELNVAFTNLFQHKLIAPSSSKSTPCNKQFIKDIIENLFCFQLTTATETTVVTAPRDEFVEFLAEMKKRDITVLEVEPVGGYTNLQLQVSRELKIREARKEAKATAPDGSFANQGAVPKFLKVKYADKAVNVYGYLNDDIICVESGEREPGIISTSELSDEDAFKVAKQARNNGFKYATPAIEEITRKYIMSNSASSKVSLVLAEPHKNYLITDLITSKEFNIRITNVLHLRIDQEKVILKRGDQLPPIFRWHTGKVLNPTGYYICPPLGHDFKRGLGLDVAKLDDAVQLLAGWMMAHQNDFYVQNILMGVRAKLPSKRNPSPASAEATIQGGGDCPKQQNGVHVENKSGKCLEEKPLTEKEVKTRASRWVRNNVKTRFLAQYNSAIQKEYREKLQDIQELVAEMAVVYSNCIGKRYISECVAELNKIYDVNSSYKWSRAPYEFEMQFNTILSALDAIITQNGDRGAYKTKRDLLWLNYVAHVRSWEELDAKIAAEEERERKEKEAREEWREERRVRAEEDRARAIEDQNAILNDIRWSLDNQPAPVNNTYIVAPPPRRRWR